MLWPPAMADLRPSILPQLREAVAVTMMLPVSAIPPEAHWTDLGVDTLDFVEIAIHLEDLSGDDFAAADIAGGDTLAESAALIDRRLAARRV